MTVHSLGAFCIGLFLVATPLGCACSGKKSISAQDAASLTGTVTYREKMALPAEAELTVSLVDTGSGSRSLASRTIRTEGKQVPLVFQLPYTLGDIRREGSYGLTARITGGGATLFETAEPLPVLTQGRPSKDLELLLRRSGS